MNDISEYIHGELIKIPFNLYNLITKYIESNNNTKVAFVGGYLRDLLISKLLIHSKFGKGEIIHIFGSGEKISLAVKFGDKGSKILDPRLAPIRYVS